MSLVPDYGGGSSSDGSENESDSSGTDSDGGDTSSQIQRSKNVLLYVLFIKMS